MYVQVGEPTKLPGPLTIEAVAVCGPASIVPLIAFTVIVSTWFVPTGLFAVAGVIAMFASTQTLLALPLPPAAVFTAVFVVRVIVCPFTGMSDVADTTVVPTAAEVIVTVQLAVAAATRVGAGVRADEAARAAHDRGGRRMRPRVDRPVDRVHRDRQHVVRVDRVRRGRRRDLDVRVHPRLLRIGAVTGVTVAGLAVQRDAQRRRRRSPRG